MSVPCIEADLQESGVLFPSQNCSLLPQAHPQPLNLFIFLLELQWPSQILKPLMCELKLVGNQMRAFGGDPRCLKWSRKVANQTGHFLSSGAAFPFPPAQQSARSLSPAGIHLLKKRERELWKVETGRLQN